MLIISVPVSYTSATGTETTGRLATVVWEDCPDAITSGREELGWNKVYADTMTRNRHRRKDHLHRQLGWNRILPPRRHPHHTHPRDADWRAGAFMHYRYRHPDFREAAYAAVLSGPSGSADIGGVTVHPAQGVTTLTVVLWPRRLGASRRPR